MIKKTALLMLIFMLIFTTISPFKTSASNKNIELYTMAGLDESSSYTWETSLFFSRMEDITGLGFTFNQETDSNRWSKTKQDYYQGKGDMPDCLFKAHLSMEEEELFYEKGLLMDLSTLIKDHAPNLNTLLEENPSYRDLISLEDGAIVALPYIDLFTAQNAMWINMEWLERLNLEKPSTKEELEVVLTAFKDKDPNRNNKQDEIPFGFIGPFELKSLSHAFGIIGDSFNIYLDQEQLVNFMPVRQEYFELTKWLKDLFSKGLLDPNGFTQPDLLRQMADKKSPVKYGVIMGPTPFNVLPEGQGENYELLFPLYDDQGKRTYSKLIPSAIGGSFAISTNCKEPEKLLAWADYLYSEEGGILAMAGLEDEDYIVLDTGLWTFIQSSSGQPLATSSQIVGSGFLPWYSPVDFELSIKDERARKSLESLKQLNDMSSSPFPEVRLSRAELAYVMPLQEKLATYVDESLARFILGEWELNHNTWQDYLDTLTSLGLADFLNFWQNIYDSRFLQGEAGK